MATQNTQTEPARKASLMDTLNNVSSNLLGKDGVKIDTRVVVGNDIYYKVGATVVITLVVCLIIFLIYKQVSKAE
jgi:hypothetical protein